MSKFSLDVSQLENKLLKKAYKLSDVKDRIEVVAFDIVKFKDNDEDANLWQIQNADDGDYIVALYEDNNVKTASTKLWEVVASNTSNTLNIFYKGDPLVKVASNKLGIPASELKFVQKYLPKKLAENKKLVQALLKEIPETTKKEILNKYPELV